MEGDPAALSRVVVNLLENATRYAAGRVNIALAESDETATLTIDDDGPGIPPEHRHRVFERFARLDQARDRDHGGAGLGLSIAKEVIDHHGGTISVDEGPMRGARVAVCLPTSTV